VRGNPNKKRAGFVREFCGARGNSGFLEIWKTGSLTRGGKIVLAARPMKKSGKSREKGEGEESVSI